MNLKPEDEIPNDDEPVTPQDDVTPDATPGAAAEPQSLADAMWGDTKDEDTVVDAEAPAEPAADAPPTDDAPADKAPDADPAKTEVSDDDLVKGLSEKAQNRFRELVNTNKELEQRLVGFQEVIAEAQVTPQDMVDLLDYGKAIRTGDFDRARAILAEQARQLELASGTAVELGDPLADYPDLKAGVDELELTRPHALELARVRRQNEAIARQTEQSQRQREQADAQGQAALAGFEAVRALAVDLSKTDLNWKAKEPLMMKRAASVQANYPPNQWAAMMRLAYDEITETMKGLRPSTPTPQPLRPNAMGGGAKAPASLHEAMWGEPDPA